MCDLYRRRGLDEKVDIWALGVLLYKLCYFTTPFETEGKLAILNARYIIPPSPIYPKHLTDLIRSTLQEDPMQRPNIYQLFSLVSKMIGAPCSIPNIYISQASLPPTELSTVLSKRIDDHPGTPVLSSPVPPPSGIRRGRPNRTTPSAPSSNFEDLSSQSPSAPHPPSNVPAKSESRSLTTQDALAEIFGAPSVNSSQKDNYNRCLQNPLSDYFNPNQKTGANCGTGASTFGMDFFGTVSSFPASKSTPRSPGWLFVTIQFH